MFSHALAHTPICSSIRLSVQSDSLRVRSFVCLLRSFVRRFENSQLDRSSHRMPIHPNVRPFFNLERKNVNLQKHNKHTHSHVHPLVRPTIWPSARSSVGLPAPFVRPSTLEFSVRPFVGLFVHPKRGILACANRVETQSVYVCKAIKIVIVVIVLLRRCRSDRIFVERSK